MPYIKSEQRLKIKPQTISYATNGGDLNYQITCLLVDYMKFNEPGYQTYNDMIGALEAAKLELYRRKVKVYEDLKMQTNGDVY